MKIQKFVEQKLHSIISPQISGTRSYSISFSEQHENAFLFRSIFRVGTHVPFCMKSENWDPFYLTFNLTEYQRASAWWSIKRKHFKASKKEQNVR